jgi:hypothetical protein
MHDHHFLWPMFWGLFALAIVLSRRYTRHRERMRALDIAQNLAEKGVVAPELVNQALQREPRRPCSPRDDIRFGAILLAVAIGLVFLGFMVSMDDLSQGRGSLFHPLYGVAAFPALIGLVIIGFGLSARNKP